MPKPPHPSHRRLLTLLLAALALVSITTYLLSLPHHTPQPTTTTTSPPPTHPADLPPTILQGTPISSRITNETLKAELGRAAWKLLHTTMAKFPDKPAQEEQTALSSYIHLFARLYPCGECASHFRQILTKFPPQVSTRSNAAAWACHVHNEVNRSLEKEMFDCSHIGDFYDCGCADEEGGKVEVEKEKETETGAIEVEVEREG